jgi:hypothetical protein
VDPCVINFGSPLLGYFDPKKLLLLGEIVEETVVVSTHFKLLLPMIFQ